MDEEYGVGVGGRSRVEVRIGIAVQIGSSTLNSRVMRANCVDHDGNSVWSLQWLTQRRYLMNEEGERMQINLYL